MDLLSQKPPRRSATGFVSVWGLASVLGLALAGCSTSAEDASGYGDATSNLSTGASGSEGSGTDSGSDEADEGDTDGEGEGDAGTMPELGPDDPDLAASMCDPSSQQVIAYGLAHANAHAEPVLVRESVLNGDGMVPPIALSSRPFLNHFDFDIAPAEAGTLEISGELWQPPMANIDVAPRYRLQYAIRGPYMDAGERLPVDLAIVVDLGAVMAGEPLALAEEALAAIESALMPGDRVTLIAAGPQPNVLASELIEHPNAMPLTGLIGQQEPAALADIKAALGLAYATITSNWDNQGQTRVLLISNGHFSHEGLVEQVEAEAAAGRYLVSLGVGDPLQFDAGMLAALAQEGRGSMLFARNADEIWLELEQRFASHMLAAAIDLEVTLKLPPGLGVRYRETLAPPPSDDELALLGPNDALVFHHELEACGELAADAVIEVQIEWSDPLVNEAKQLVWLHDVHELDEGSAYGHKGAATVAYARALRAYRDNDPSLSYGAVLEAASLISEALGSLPEDRDLAEMSAVMAKLSGR